MIINNARPMSEPYVADRILSFLDGVPKEASVLDIACGQGYLSEKLFQKGFENIHCTDINESNFKLNKKQFNFQKVDANQKLPYKDQIFDVVISSETIEHLENPQLFLREVYRILKTGGLFILTTPSIEGIISRIYFLFTGKLAFHTDNDYRLSGHITIIPGWLIRRFVCKIGFKELARTYNCFYLPILKIRFFHSFFLNRFWGWIGIYKFVK